MDPSSDWNAPSEAWVNYEEPTLEPPPTKKQPVPEPAKADLLLVAAVSTTRRGTKSVLEYYSPYKCVTHSCGALSVAL